MRPRPNKRIERHQVEHPMGLQMFVFSRPGGISLRVIVGEDEAGWEHVSVVAMGANKEPRTPSWDEMAWVKRQFWLPEEVCIQIHPAEANYVNVHEHCLHIWRPLDAPIPVPPILGIGVWPLPRTVE